MGEDATTIICRRMFGQAVTRSDHPTATAHRFFPKNSFSKMLPSDSHLKVRLHWRIFVTVIVMYKVYVSIQMRCEVNFLFVDCEKKMLYIFVIRVTNCVRLKHAERSENLE